MPSVAVSVDVWDTLIKLERFYEVLSVALAELLSRDVSEVKAALASARARVKELRAQGDIDPTAIVAQCTAILARELSCSRETVKRGVARAVAYLNPDGMVFEDAIESLETLSRENVPVVALSNVMWWPGYITRVIVERVGLGKLLTAQVYADEVFALKPEYRVFKAGEEALRDSGLDTKLGAHAGDDFREDFLGALSSGLVAVLVDRKRSFEEGIYFGGRGYVVRDLRELPRILSRIR